MKILDDFPREGLPEPILEQHQEWVDLYWKALKIGWNNIRSVRKAKWLPHMACMPDTPKIWQWDSCFMAMYCRFLNNKFPGMNNLDNLYMLQRNDGYINFAYDINTEQPAWGLLINPPLYAWVEWENYLQTGDNERLSRIFPVIVKYFDWIKNNRRRKNGLYWFEFPGASGMDNSPRGGSYDLTGSDICHVDLNSQQALSALYLARIADVLGSKKLSARFKKEYELIKKAVNLIMWHEPSGFYYDTFNDYPYYLHSNWLNHKTIAGFWPLLAGIAGTGRRVNRLIGHLQNPKEFYRRHLVPTLSCDDPNYNPDGGYWLGGVWAPTNYMVVKGLQYSGRFDLAHLIASNHIMNMVSVWKKYRPHSIWECYSPEYNRPATNPRGELVKDNFVGWSGLGPVAMLIEHILGLTPNLPENNITWHINLLEKHGLRNLRFGDGYIDLLCAERKNLSQTIAITIKSDCAFRIYILVKARQFKFDIAPGRNTLKI